MGLNWACGRHRNLHVAQNVPIHTRPDVILETQQVISSAVSSSFKDLMHLLVGTGGSHFHELDLDLEKATLIPVSKTESPSPGWLVLDGGVVYAVAEVEGTVGQLARFERVDDRWKLSWRSDASEEGTCHSSIVHNENGLYVLGANYTGHSVDVFSTDGKLLHSIPFEGSGPFEGRQETSHCHQIVPDLLGKYIYVNDLGGDYQYRYTLNQDGQLQQRGLLKFKPAQGPRHCAFNPVHQDLVYTICELSNEIEVHDWSSGTPEQLQSVSIIPDSSMAGQKHPDYPQPASAGEIQITSDGKFLYASTRYLPKHKSDTLLWARLDDKGLLGKETHHDTGLIAPWHFSLSPDEKYLAAAFKDSNVVKVFKRNTTDGSLEDLCSIDTIELPSCVLFVN